ncbi:MAG: tRNA (adenosine(37)-N6)-threonylcarbamoyltransferase complex dimerization subunit type 1 TsaB [Clostridia bacterium]
MILLALCTSGPAASAALIVDGSPVLQKLASIGLTHSETIMPLIDSLLCENSLRPCDVDVFAADIGPGSFTGVRIGVCAANAMAAACKKPVVGVSSLEALCFGQTAQSVCALLDCRNGNGYAMHYIDGKVFLPPSAVVIDTLLHSIPSETLFVGDHALHRELILSNVSGARFGSSMLTADMTAAAAWSKFAAGESTNEILPLYLRPSQAERLHKEMKE